MGRDPGGTNEWAVTLGGTNDWAVTLGGTNDWAVTLEAPMSGP